MAIDSVNPAITPKQLYKKFLNGERPEYEHSIESDKPMQELNVLAERYKQTMSIDDKKKLLDHERNILYEELEHPELTLARNYKEISWFIKPETEQSQTKNTINNLNLTALTRIESLDNPFETTYTNEKAERLENLLKSIDKQSTYEQESREKINDVKRAIEYFSKNYTKPNIPAKINQIETLDDFHELLLNADKSDYPFVRKYVNNILNGESHPLVKQAAVWGAGKFRSDENFDIIKKIALDNNEQDIKLREFAIHSTALYIKEKPDEVKSIMSAIEKDGSIFAPLGKTLNAKVNGRHKGVKDRELKGLNKKQISRYKKLKNRFIKTDTDINTHQHNAIDKSLLFYRKILGNFVNKGNNIFISNDTYTKIFPKRSGIRCFSNGLLNSGDFWDSFDGINTPKYSMINISRIDDEKSQSTTGHEIAHALNREFDKTDNKKLRSLYVNAYMNENTLDSYAAVNEAEYFAQGCEAYISEYKPHACLLDNNSTTNTRYDLMVKDPDLYKFIEKCVKKYH